MKTLRTAVNILEACVGWVLFPFALVLTAVAVIFTREG
jgi:hypothetical protein